MGCDEVPRPQCPPNKIATSSSRSEEWWRSCPPKYFISRFSAVSVFGSSVRRVIGKNDRGIQLEADRPEDTSTAGDGSSNDAGLHGRKYLPVNLLDPCGTKAGHPTDHRRASPHFRKRSALHRNAPTLPNGVGFLPHSTRDGISGRRVERRAQGQMSRKCCQR